MNRHNEERNQLLLIAMFILLFVVSCVDPPFPHELVLQHVPTAAFLVALLAFVALVAEATLPATLLPATELICESCTQPTQALDSESAAPALSVRIA